MKRVGYLYEKMCDLSLIKLAIHKAAQGKTNKHFIKKVLANEEKFALKLRDMLVNNEVRLSPNRTIQIYDRSCMKERLITVSRCKFYKERIYGIAPRNKLKKIVSNHAKKEAKKNGKDKGIQQRAVAC